MTDLLEPQEPKRRADSYREMKRRVTEATSDGLNIGT